MYPVPRRAAHLTSTENVNYKWKIFVFVEWAVDGDYDDGCLVGAQKPAKPKGRRCFYHAKFPAWLIGMSEHLVIFIVLNRERRDFVGRRELTNSEIVGRSWWIVCAVGRKKRRACVWVSDVMDKMKIHRSMSDAHAASRADCRSLTSSHERACTCSTKNDMKACSSSSLKVCWNFFGGLSIFWFTKFWNL